MSLAPLQRRFSRGFALAIAAVYVVVVGVAACQVHGGRRYHSVTAERYSDPYDGRAHSDKSH